jgi:hypothetical protein
MPSKCKTKDCGKEATYGPPESKSRISCSTHKEPGMECKKTDSRKCLFCSKRPSFALPGEKAKYCLEHAPKDVANVNAKMCEVCGKSQPSFGIKGKRATHCAKCAKTCNVKLYDLISALCNFDGCEKNATQGFLGDKNTRCKKHREDGMVDVKNKKCELCKKQATFGIEKPTHCKLHKTDDMNDLRHDSERCSGYDDGYVCSKRATFGFDRAVKCKYHMEEGMKDLVSKMCIVCNEKQPNFNFKNEPALYCNMCKKDKMIDVSHPQCVSCNLFQVHKKGDGCSYCNLDGNARKKTREMSVVNYLRSKNIDFIHDKSTGVAGSKPGICRNFRPDILIDCNTHFLVVEVDEDQHKVYAESCEVIRMLNIHESLGMRTVFIRFNPDLFYFKEKRQNISDPERLELLNEMIQIHSILTPEKELTVYRMFYDTDQDLSVSCHTTEYDITPVIAEL